jgi:hypothetical protein
VYIALFQSAPSKWQIGVFTLLVLCLSLAIINYVPIRRLGCRAEFFTALWGAVGVPAGFWILISAMETPRTRELSYVPLWSKAALGAFVVLFLTALAAIPEVGASGGASLAFATDSGRFQSYQALGDGLAVTALLAIPVVSRTPLGASMLIAASLASTFYSASRASLYCQIVAALIAAAACGRRTVANLLILIACATGALCAFGVQDDPRARELWHRMTVLFVSPGHDASYLGRISSMAVGLTSITDHIWFGRFMDELFTYGAVGAYIHNWLSFCASFGILAFGAFLVLFTVAWWTCHDRLLRRATTYPAVLGLMTYSSLAICTARAYIWPYIWLAIVVAFSEHGRLCIAPATPTRHVWKRPASQWRANPRGVRKWIPPRNKKRNLCTS